MADSKPKRDRSRSPLRRPRSPSPLREVKSSIQLPDKLPLYLRGSQVIDWQVKQGSTLCFLIWVCMCIAALWHQILLQTLDFGGLLSICAIVQIRHSGTRCWNFRPNRRQWKENKCQASRKPHYFRRVVRWRFRLDMEHNWRKQGIFRRAIAETP